MKRGFSLLEIVLALAILAGSLAALGEVMRIGGQNAALARDETQAQLLAESVMAEMLAGARPITAVSATVFDLVSDPPWTYAIAVEPTTFQELVAVRVSVTQQLGAEMQPARCDVVRWMLNPDFVTAQLTAQAAATREASSSSTTGDSSRSGSGQNGGSGGGLNSPGGQNQNGGGR